MAITWSAKAPGAVYRYTWTPDVQAGDGLASAVLTVADGDAVIDSYETEGDVVVAYLSGGSAGTTTTIEASAETNDGETLAETIYLPVIVPDATIAPTANDVCAFALRKIAGNGVDADAAELEDALERLNMMLAAWRRQGADVGAPLPILSSTELLIADEFVEAVKFNLRNRLHRHYGEPLDAMDVAEANRGLQLVKAANLPSEREGAEYY